ncbi:beta-ketoacyl synthase chain length factor [Vibrio sp. S11_S32]|uniref:beta-ketoacyl synthase chain length factor n=1 Tax=Vibrio sp. S11_S32 TaxID=2720225 RepID=UPI0016801BAE|nr:beta-ketoacyl synthase chain length factor [Vibrio sp. S11_S32]MBD1575189.1 beta-ketoacyl synthase chain length factor [Vibrio sp. S11_S32]
MSTIAFNIQHWQALSCGLDSSQSWQAWAQLKMTVKKPSQTSQAWPQDTPTPKSDLIPAMMRRRMSPLSKQALQVAISLKQRLDTQQQAIDYLIFSCRHGELARTTTLLQQVLSGEDASPTAFSQSVHNTSAGLFTIATHSPIPATSLAAGESTLHHALIEASSYLSQHPTHRVLVIDFDESLSQPYQHFESQPHPGYAFGLVLTHGNQVELSWRKNSTPNRTKSSISPPIFETQSLQILANLALPQSQWQIDDSRICWQWHCDSTQISD